MGFNMLNIYLCIPEMCLQSCCDEFVLLICCQEGGKKCGTIHIGTRRLVNSNRHATLLNSYGIRS